MRKPNRFLITRMMLVVLAVALSPLTFHAKNSTKDLTIEVVETQEERFLGAKPPTATYSAKVILGDGARAFITCLFPFGDSCGEITPWTPTEKTPSAECQYSDYEGGYASCTRRNLGTYRAKRKDDALTIYTRKGQVKYQIAGPWPGDSNAGQDKASDASEATSWNRLAIRAQFIELAASDRTNAIKLWYTLTNANDADYRIENLSGITTAVAAHGKTDFLYAFNQGMISLELPLMIPAHRSISTILTVALQTNISVADHASAEMVANYKRDVLSFLRSKYANMQGFVVMDDRTRFEIDFPAGPWSETADKWEQK